MHDSIGLNIFLTNIILLIYSINTGLCGNNDDVKESELRTPWTQQPTHVKNDTKFGISWVVPGDNCQDPGNSLQLINNKSSREVRDHINLIICCHQHAEYSRHEDLNSGFFFFFSNQNLRNFILFSPFFFFFFLPFFAQFHMLFSVFFVLCCCFFFSGKVIIMSDIQIYK